MTLLDLMSALSLCAGLAFFVTGTVGLVRFPDVFCRLHAITKADNLGLGLVVLALLPHAADAAEAFKLLLIWVFVLIASACVGFLIAHEALASTRSSERGAS